MMAALVHEASAAPSPNTQAQGFDIDQYLNLDTIAVPTPSTSPANTSKAFPTPSLAPVGSSTLAHQAPPPSQQSFSAPSHQYEQYKQQTGLPVGALANTFALNDPERYQFPSSYLIDSPTNGFFGMNTVEPESDFMDFNSIPEQTPSGDLEMDYRSMQMNNSSFINPAAVTAAGTQSYSQTTLPGRVWPGMHRQAAMAKAQQQAQQQAALAAQRERSTSTQSRHPSVANERENEDVVEESISRLLNRMRNSSVTSSMNEDSQGPIGGSSSRQKKDEEDMDEDERLLASEEGKKLSSKERRQLRNKVSARAFRSRRKEYIGQLEGELATKTAEADDLRAKNAELVAENTRLTDLTRLLLSSPAFSQFLNDLSGTGAHTSTIQGLAQSGHESQAQPPLGQQQQQQQPQQMPVKDANPNQYNLSRSQNNMQLNMAIIPEEPTLEAEAPTTGRYTPNSNSIYGAYDAQVFALPYLPEAPALDAPDFTLLNDKTSSTGGLYPRHESSVSDSKDAPAPIEPLPLPSTRPQDTAALSNNDTIEESTEMDYVPLEMDDSDPIFALYADDGNTAPSSPASADDPILSREPTAHKLLPGSALVLVPHCTILSPETLHRFERLCEDADAIVARLNQVTAQGG